MGRRGVFLGQWEKIRLEEHWCLFLEQGCRSTEECVFKKKIKIESPQHFR